MFDRLEHNYPQEYEKGPYCPHSTLVEICNSLAGNNVTPQEFCTETLDVGKLAENSMDFIESGDLSARTSCSISCLMLNEQLKMVKSDFKKIPTEEEIHQKLNIAKTLNDKFNIIKHYKTGKSIIDEKDTIINRWRQVIFEVSCSTTDDEENGHFRRLKSADELSEKEIIKKVEQFTKSLDKIVGHKKGSFIFVREGAKNCKQSPQPRHIGAYID